MRVRARMTPAGVLCGTGGVGDRATDQAPETRRPHAAQSVVPGGLRAHTRETASPSPRGGGGGGPCRKWSRRSASPPRSMPLGGSGDVWGGGACTLGGPGDKWRRRRGEPPPRCLAGRVGMTPPSRSPTRPRRAGGHRGDVPRGRPMGGPHLLLLLLGRVLGSVVAHTGECGVEFCRNCYASGANVVVRGWRSWMLDGRMGREC